MTSARTRSLLAASACLWLGSMVVRAGGAHLGHFPPRAAEPAARSASLPTRLSETGLYADASTLTVDPRNRPFAPQYPLWSDDATKRRWVRLPDGAAIDARNIDH